MPTTQLAGPAPIAMPNAKPLPLLFDNLRKFELMAFGVPEEWVDDVRRATAATLFDLLGHRPQEAQEALLKLAVEEQPAPQSLSRPTLVHSNTLTPNVASAFSRTSRNWSALSILYGRNGGCFCTQPNARW